MIDRGALSHIINAGIVTGAGAPLPAAVESNLAAWGGDVALARTLLDGVPDRRPAVIALACWRAGAVRLRASALASAGRLLAEDPGAAVAFAAALRVPPGHVEETLRAVAASPFAWPAGVPDTIAVVGGFLGLDGPFLTAITDVRELDRPDRFLISTSTERVLLAVDVAGHVFTRVDDDVSGAPTARIVADGFELTVRGL